MNATDPDNGRAATAARRPNQAPTQARSRYDRRTILRGALGAAGAAGAGLLLTRQTAAQGARLIPAQPGAGLTAAVAAAPTSAAQGAVSVYPIPGTRTASAASEISFRGISADALGAIKVVGAQSGAHSGLVQLHADGAGASFLPDAPFQASEQVTVQTALDVQGGAQGAFHFTVAQPATPPAAAATRATATPRAALSFHSRTDLKPPPITVTIPPSNVAPGAIFLGAKTPDGQNGAMIVDDQGRLVWFAPQALDVNSVNDFRVQQYQGQPVLTWWEGVSTGGHGLGHYRILDGAYQELARLRVGNGYAGADLHEFLLTPQNTALFSVYNMVQWDLSAIGGPAAGTAVDGIIQEVEVATGRVLYEWHSLDHVGLDESYIEPAKDAKTAYDYFHLNSVALDNDGHLIVSARHTWGIYKVDRQSGAVIWRLNGKKSDFQMGAGTITAYQHDAQIQPNGDLTIFDNGAGSSGPPVHTHSRGVVIGLDTDKMTATLKQEYVHPDGLLAASQGNVQVLPNGNVFIGWGQLPVYSEFSGDGKLLYDARFPDKDYSYRAFRSPWVGRPTDKPAVAAAPAANGLTLYASWNGATEVAAWHVLAGPDPAHLQAVGTAPRAGFETTITMPAGAAYVAVAAQDGAGQVLATSDPIKTAP